MPILTITLVGPKSKAHSTLAARIASAAGAVFSSTPGDCWVFLHVLPLSQYAENGLFPKSTPHPIWVRVLKYANSSPSARKREGQALTLALAKACKWKPEHVHVVYEPPGKGRVAFGGKLVT